ncbi:MAG: hypothetical protein ABIQ17_04665 [Candidatus Limnocylindrales bacterium]
MTTIEHPSAVPLVGQQASRIESFGRPWPSFAHASEAEMARILDFYAVRWEYEPQTFPILWNLDGEVVESFSPDFYLPEIDLYLEMTTLKQRLVRKKNRKLRRLRDLYPAIRIKLFYARDFRAMMLKYGRLALADSLSGTLGQIASERVHLKAPIVDPGIDQLSVDPGIDQLSVDPGIDQLSVDPGPAHDLSAPETQRKPVSPVRRRRPKRSPSPSPDMLVPAGPARAAGGPIGKRQDPDTTPTQEAPRT